MKRNKKKRTTIAIEREIHALGVKLARQENRDFSGMISNAITERWAARKIKPSA